MTGVEWEEPPADARSTNGNRNYDDLRAALRATPGRWAVIRRDAPLFAAGNLRRSKVWAEFEITARGTQRGPVTVYARYIGDAS